MNIRAYALKSLALLMIAQHGITMPMNTNASKTDAEKKAEKERAHKNAAATLSPQEHAALEQMIKDLQPEIDAALNDTKDIDPQKIIDECDLGDYATGNQSNLNPNDFIPGFGNLNNTAKAFRKEQERAKYQNTVLIGHPKVPVALYRRDLMELPFFVADITMAYLYFEHIKAKRVEHIYKTITEHASDYIERFTQLKELAKNLEDPNANKQEINQKIKDLWAPFLEQQSYVGNNPFKQEVVIPFITTLLGYKLSRYAQEQCMVKRSFTDEAHYAYTQDKDGDYQRFQLEGLLAAPTMDELTDTMNKLERKKRINENFEVHEYYAGTNTVCNPNDDLELLIKSAKGIFLKPLFPGNAPVSTLGFIKNQWLPNANADHIEDQIPEVEQVIPEGIFSKGLYDLAGLPKWFYAIKNSRIMRLAVEVSVLAAITTRVDNVHNATWVNHIDKNAHEFILLLRNYEAVKHLPDDHEEKQMVRNYLLTFIQTGNTCTSWKDACTKFFFEKQIGRMIGMQKLSTWTFSAVSLGLFWNYGRPAFNLARMFAKHGGPSEAHFFALFYGGQFTLLWGLFTLAATIEVYQDICWVKDKIKNSIKSFFRRNDDDTEKTEASSEQSHEPNKPKEATA